MNRPFCISLLLAALLGGCGPQRLPEGYSPQPLYPGAGDRDRDGVADARDRCPRDAAPRGENGCDTGSPRPPSRPAEDP